MHAPVFQVDKNRKAGKKFAADAKADIKAVIELLYARGMIPITCSSNPGINEPEPI